MPSARHLQGNTRLEASPYSDVNVDDTMMYSEGIAVFIFRSGTFLIEPTPQPLFSDALQTENFRFCLFWEIARESNPEVVSQETDETPAGFWFDAPDGVERILQPAEYSAGAKELERDTDQRRHWPQACRHSQRCPPSPWRCCDREKNKAGAVRRWKSCSHPLPSVANGAVC